MTDKEKKALALAIKAIYFDDNSDYASFLWDIIDTLGGEDAVNMLENDEQLAYETYCNED